MAHNVANVAVVVMLEGFLVPTVNLQATAVAVECRSVAYVGRGHIHSHHFPVAFREFVCQTVAVKVLCDVDNLGSRGDALLVVANVGAPFIVVPIWLRGLVHLGEDFLAVLLNHRLF